jgi:hypothetical protein
VTIVLVAIAFVTIAFVTIAFVTIANDHVRIAMIGSAIAQGWHSFILLTSERFT